MPGITVPSPVRPVSRRPPVAGIAVSAVLALVLLHGSAPCPAAESPPPAGDAPRKPTTGSSTDGNEKTKEKSKEGKERKEGERPRPDRAKTDRPIWGVISKVDDGALYLLIGDAGREVIVPVQPESEVLVAGKKATFADLGPGWSVNIIQEQGLTRTINARPPRPKPPAKAAPPAATGKQP
jgi:hypothetical protein